MFTLKIILVHRAANSMRLRDIFDSVHHMTSQDLFICMPHLVLQAEHIHACPEYNISAEARRKELIKGVSMLTYDERRCMINVLHA